MLNFLILTKVLYKSLKYLHPVMFASKKSNSKHLTGCFDIHLSGQQPLRSGRLILCYVNQ